MARPMISWVLLFASFFLFHSAGNCSADDQTFDANPTQPTAAPTGSKQEINLTNLGTTPSLTRVETWNESSQQFVAETTEDAAILFEIKDGKLRRKTKLFPNARYRVTISHTKDMKVTQFVVPLAVKSGDLTIEREAPAPSTASISLTGSSNSLTSLYSAFPQHAQRQFEDLVVDEARGWGASGRDRDRRNYVFHYDYTPEDTCRKIATILRDTATVIGTKTAVNVAEAETELKGRFEQFYKEGDSRFRTKNPRKEDWQPFLQHIDQEAHKKMISGLETSPAYLQIVLLEMANGFERLAKEITGLENSVGGSASSNSASGTTGSGVTGSGVGTSSRRRSRRCGCWSLLLAP